MPGLPQHIIIKNTLQWLVPQPFSLPYSHPYIHDSRLFFHPWECVVWQLVGGGEVGWKGAERNGHLLLKPTEAQTSYSVY